MSNINPLAMTAPDNPLSDKELIRLLVFAQAKCYKTGFCGTGGEVYRTTILDGDNNNAILKSLPESTRKNIQIIPLAGKPNKPAFVMFLSALLKEQEFLWDIDNEEITNMSYVKAGGRYLDVSLARLTSNDLLVVDSWTKLCTDAGISYMNKKNINPLGGDKKEFDYYGFQDLVLDRILGAMNCLPCHLAITAHEHYYTSKISDGMMTKEITTLQMVSSTGKHAAKLPAHLQDVLYFKKNDNDIEVHTRGNGHRVGGAPSLPEGVHKLSTFNFKQYAELGGYAPATSLEWEYPNPFQFVTGEQLLAIAQKNQSQSTVGNGIIKANK